MNYLSHNKKKGLKLCVEIIVMMMIIIGFVIINNIINSTNEKKDNGYIYYIDKLLYDNEFEEIIIQGWCIKDGMSCPDELSRKNFRILLCQNDDVNNAIEIPVIAYKRTDVNRNYGTEEMDYTFSGFSGSLKTDSSILNSKYRVVFQYDSTIEKYYYTTRYFVNGELIVDN